MKIIIFVFIALILFSLGSALYFLIKDQGQSKRTLRALALRISLSFILFLMLMFGYYFGWITPHAL